MSDGQLEKLAVLRKTKPARGMDERGVHSYSEREHLIEALVNDDRDTHAAAPIPTGAPEDPRVTEKYLPHATRAATEPAATGQPHRQQSSTWRIRARGQPGKILNMPPDWALPKESLADELRLPRPVTVRASSQS